MQERRERAKNLEELEQKVSFLQVNANKVTSSSIMNDRKVWEKRRKV